MNRAVRSLIAAGAVLWPAGALLAGGEGHEYPKTQTIDQSDEYFGTKVADPYRWLEDDVRQSSQVKEWVAAQNAVTFAYLDSLPEREPIKRELTKLWNYERFSAPTRRGDVYIYSRNDGLQNQSVVFVTDDFNKPGRVLIDPNTWSADGTVALTGTAFTDDAKYMAYGIAKAGSDWNEWRIRDVATGEDLPDVLRWVKFSGASWLKDGSGFYYSRFDEPKSGQEFQALNHFQKVYFHKVGTDQSEDTLVFQNKNEPEWGFGAGVSEDGRWLIITTWKGTDNKYRIDYKDLSKPDSKFVNLIDKFEYDYSFLGNDGGVFYFFTDNDAPRGRVIAIDTAKPDPANWKTIIAQAPEVLRSVNIVNNRFIAEYLKDATAQVKIFDKGGLFVREVEFPALGSAGGFNGESDHTETFYSFSSFAVPPSIYRYDMITGKSTLLRQSAVDFSPDEFVTERVFFTSKDGTKVPMFITHRKDIDLNGQNPTLLYGYGGFNIPITPGFSNVNAMWLKMGGVYASVCLRGGGEYGKAWHEAGKKTNKQNVFDDFISAAEWLIENHYTSPEKLAIRGGSNGGLLVGAVITQRPDLFGVALPAVGVMDMLRFHKFTAGRFWTDDYGSSEESPEMFRYLLGYSPYHNIRSGTAYPATLVTTADTDDRVVPGHSFKFAAAIQEAHDGPNPVMIRIETSAGHGAGKPTEKQIIESADILAFTAHNLNMSLPFTAP